jgi:septal ring factor EnvC (AmiA/AmiB activator)
VDLTQILISAVLLISVISLIYLYLVNIELKKQVELLKSLQENLSSLERYIENNKIETKKILENYRVELKEEIKKQTESLKILHDKLTSMENNIERNLQDKLVVLERNIENNRIETRKILEVYKTELKSDISKVEKLLREPIDIHELVRD